MGPSDSCKHLLLRKLSSARLAGNNIMHRVCDNQYFKIPSRSNMAQELVEFVKTTSDDDDAGCGLIGNKVWQNFYNCKYGVFTTFVHMPSGYVNVTALCCDSSGRQFKQWGRLNNSK